MTMFTANKIRLAIVTAFATGIGPAANPAGAAGNGDGNFVPGFAHDTVTARSTPVPTAASTRPLMAHHTQ